MDVKEFKKIDAHAHIGEFGGWAKLSINAEQLIAQMDEFNIEKTLLCSEPNEICLDAVEKYPDRFVGMVYPNPYDGQKAVDMIYDYVQNKGFKGIKGKSSEACLCCRCRADGSYHGGGKGFEYSRFHALRTPSLFFALEHCASGRTSSRCEACHDSHGAWTWGIY